MWQQPKTDWQWIDDDQGDFFTHADYNRIKGNIEFLAEYAKELYIPFKIKDMGADKTENDYPYADEINLLATNLQEIVDHTYALNIGRATTYEDNGRFIGFEDLNRIESACLAIYENIGRIKRGKYRLGFRLGARRIRI